MEYTEIMVRYGELSTKGRNRKAFINQLGRNVRNTLHAFPNVKVQAHRDRMHLKLNGEVKPAYNSRLETSLWYSDFFTSDSSRKRIICYLSNGD